jgi:hypothetical protein
VEAIFRFVPNIVGDRVEIIFQAPHAIDAIYTQVAKVLAGEETLVRCVVNPGDVTWRDGEAFTHTQLRSAVSLVNVYARARGCYELSRAASTGEPIDLAICGIDGDWMDAQLRGFVNMEWVLRGNCGGDVYWRIIGEPRWHAATRRRTLLGDAEYFHFLRPYDVVRVQVRYAVLRASLAEASALLATAARVTVADYEDALFACQATRAVRHRLGMPDEGTVADRWNVAEIVATSEPLIDAAAGLIVAGAFDMCGVELEEAVARSDVLVEVVVRTLSVDAAAVTVVPLDAANDEDATALGAARSVEDHLRDIPIAGDTNAFDATMAMLHDHFAAPAPAPIEDEDATATPGPLHDQRVYLGKGGEGTVKSRCEAVVLRLGGAVVRASDDLTLVILSNDHRKKCQSSYSSLLPRHRIVRERWLLRLEGLAPGAELPDTRPDAVYAQARDLLDPASYWYDAEYAHTGGALSGWERVRADWTPSAQAGDAAA